ncbi:MAG: hypothetical protein ABI367_10800 [Mucilaginibacter sp.]
MKISIKIGHKAPLLLYATVCSLTVNAQKLPNKQETALFAPTNVKIDGKTTEWGNTFQAYNKATEVFYTIANDNDNLYLIIQATEPIIARKIIAGGITFAINTPEKSKKGEQITISYPVFDSKNAPNINLRINTDDLSQLDYDLFIYDLNTEFAKKSKEIKLSGIKAIDDTLISIYNEYKIKPMAAFDDKKQYTYELALPLKYLKPAIGPQSSFSYTITLNGSTRVEGARIEYIEGGIRITSPGTSAPSMNDMKFISSPTYFTGEYTLAKK